MTATDPGRIPLLAALGPKEQARVLKALKSRTYEAGDVVVREGDPALHVFLVANGQARVEREEEGPVGRLRTGDFFGELALLEEHGRTATVIAEEDLTCYLVPVWEFRSLLEEHPRMAIPMLHALIARLHGREHHSG